MIEVDKELVAGVKRGERDSQKSLYKILSPIFYTNCVNRCIPAEDIEGILVYTFVKLFDLIQSNKIETGIAFWCYEEFLKTIDDYYNKQKFPYQIIK